MNQPNQMYQPNQPFVENEINLRDYWRVLVRRRALILGVTAFAVIATVIFVLLRPNIYQSKATIMPLGQSVGGLQGALGDLGGFLPLNLGGAVSPAPSERILAILGSRTLAEDVIERLDLLPRLFTKQWNAEKQQWQTDEPPTLHDAVRHLEKLMSIESDGKTGVIAIAAEHTDPDLAATMANQYLDALQRIMNENAFSLAKKKRLFIEDQLQKTRHAMTVAEEDLRQFEQTYKIVSLDAQAEEAVRAIATLQAGIMAKEVQLGVLQRTVTGASREVTLLQEELQGMRAQLSRLQQNAPASPLDAGNQAKTTQMFPSFEEAPEIKLHYMRLKREAQIQNNLFMLLTQQLEQAKIDEAKDEMAFQVLDRAIPPDKKIKPKRRQSVILATFVGAFLGIFLAFFVEYLDDTVRTREQVERQGGVVLLATIPPPVPHRRRHQQDLSPSQEVDLVVHQAPDSPVAEAYRYLHTRLTHLDGGRDMRSVVFTSIGPDDATPTTLINLASVAASGTKILLVDGNLRQPTLHNLLQCPLAPGFTEILAEPEAWQKGIQTTMVDNLYLLPAGTRTPGSFPSVQSSAFDALLGHMRERYELILFAAPPVSGMSDAAMLAGNVDATCLVLTLGASRIEAVAEAKAALEAVQANVIGAVLRAG